MQLTGPALQGLCHRISISMRVLGIRYKGCGENGTREYGNGANRTLSRYMTVRNPTAPANPPGQLYLATKPEIGQRN
jgi:hypothetical protein